METTEYVQYYVNNIPWVRCAVGSLLDLAIQDIIKAERAAETRRITKLLRDYKTISIRQEPKDILKVSTRGIQ